MEWDALSEWDEGTLFRTHFESGLTENSANIFRNSIRSGCGHISFRNGLVSEMNHIMIIRRQSINSRLQSFAQLRPRWARQHRQAEEHLPAQSCSARPFPQHRHMMICGASDFGGCNNSRLNSSVVSRSGACLRSSSNAFAACRS